MSGCSVCNLLSVLPSTTFRLFNLFRLTEVSLVIHFISVRTNEYERLIGLQTIVRTSSTTFRVFNLFRLTEVRASIGYERLIGLQTPGFLPVSPNRSQSVTTNISYWSLCSVLPAVPPTIFAAFYLCFSAIMSGSGSFSVGIHHVDSTSFERSSAWMPNYSTEKNGDLTEQEYNIYSQSQQRPPPYITTPPALAPRTLIVIRSTVLLPGLQVPVGLR
ncbi:hypothetical protein T07_734 [Trichinella nelsoni]|uniref:Uncharacterized protein n=1 Tax=Trichinella nelsoni TaxID=6336 RepID=A0A0V0S867_9BILA|nr:hypothetical protein T07_734 [Trichinella nelsoni]